MRVLTQAASLRAERQSSNSSQSPTQLATLAKPVGLSATDASQTKFSQNLRAELRSVNEARLATLRGYAHAENEEELLDANQALHKLRDLARKRHVDDHDDATEYLAIQDQIRRMQQSRQERSEEERDQEAFVGAEYFADQADFARTQQIKPLPQSAKSMDEVIGNVSEYSDYLTAVKKRLETRLDRLAAMTRDLCAAEEAIATDDFAGDVAHFTHEKILGEASKSAETHKTLAPHVALSLISA